MLAMWYGVLADITALLHGLVVLYIAGGLVAIPIGLWRRSRFARRFWFRFPHLILCVVVPLFELFNEPCPLTTLEQWLRGQQAAGGTYEGSFIAHYVHAAIHLPVPPEALAAPLFVVLALVVGLYIWRGPERKAKGRAGEDVKGGQ